MHDPVAGVDPAAPADLIEARLLPRPALARERQRVDDRAPRGRDRRQACARELHVEEAHVEGGVVRDDRGGVEDGEDLPRALVEAPEPDDVLVADAVDRGRAGGDRPLRIEAPFPDLSGRAPVAHLDERDLDQAVALAVGQARGFGVEHKLAPGARERRGGLGGESEQRGCGHRATPRPGGGAAARARRSAPHRPAA